MPMTVSEAALFARLKRKLWREERLTLRRCSDRSPWRQDLGRYYMTNDRNHIAGYHVSDLEDFARDLGVMRADEQLAD
jgi:Fe-S cluster biosynthesis and repair protein YggX